MRAGRREGSCAPHRAFAHHNIQRFAASARLGQAEVCVNTDAKASSVCVWVAVGSHVRERAGVRDAAKCEMPEINPTHPALSRHLNRLGKLVADVCVRLKTVLRTRWLVFRT